MGFIDYQGTKENRYTDVLEFAKAQQEEEAKRLEDEKVGKWVAKYIGNSRYSGINLNDLIKYIIVRYRNLSDKKNSLIDNKSIDNVDEAVLWKDFSIALIVRRLEGFNLPADKKNTYYRTFVEKVFKLTEYTPSEKHYSSIEEMPSYNRYFADCFDLVQEKQFWKWLGSIGEKQKSELLEFVDIYKQLSILLGYYLFLGIRPGTDDWMRRIEIECQVLDKLKADYGKGLSKHPNYTKLQNPLYDLVKAKRETKATGPDNKTENSIGSGKAIEDPVRSRRPQLDKKRFEELIASCSLPNYTEACRLLRNCELPETMDELYQTLILRIPVLQESIDKFEDVYQPDMYSFYEYYIPEALQITETYLEYLDVGIGEAILQETEKEVLEAANKLLIAVNDKIDEIYKFASIEIKAKAKALESLMSQDGYVDPKFKIN